MITPPEHMAQKLQKSLRSMLPNAAGVCVLPKCAAAAPLFDVEKSAMTNATADRTREFVLGRTAARRALSELGLSRVPIPVGADRAPVWPDGIAGSISHNSLFCVAAVAPSEIAAALGVDVELADPLHPDLQPLILTKAEQKSLDRVNSGEMGVAAKLIFSAKEAVFKCQYALTRQMIGFDAVDIRLNRANNRFTATFGATVGPFLPGSTLQGRINAIDGTLLTSAHLSPQQHASHIATRRPHYDHIYP